MGGHPHFFSNAGLDIAISFKLVELGILIFCKRLDVGMSISVQMVEVDIPIPFQRWR